MEEGQIPDITKKIFFVAVHLACLAALWTGVSWAAVAVCALMYFVRMFAITGGYHRYFSHRSYKTSRFFQTVLALLGASAAQNGPLWWVSHHRYHHQHSDTEQDIHPPSRGLWWAHVGWVLSREFSHTRWPLIRDLAKFPELRFIDRYNTWAPVLLGASLFAFGAWCAARYPQLNTSAMQMLIWGFFISTVLVYHGTFAINSLTHAFGKRRFNTSDNSRNSFLLALVTLGEGWHNNHHRYPGSERQGFYWWEIDPTHYVLRVLAALGIVWDLRAPPEKIYQEALNGAARQPASGSRAA